MPLAGIHCPALQVDAISAYAMKTLLNSYLSESRKKRLGELLTDRFPERQVDEPSPELSSGCCRTPGCRSPDTGGATAGCVSLPQSELVAVLRWLNPADCPVIRITGVA